MAQPFTPISSMMRCAMKLITPAVTSRFLKTIAAPLLAACCLLLLVPRLTLADGLEVTISDPTQVAAPNGTVVFEGTITNDTGADLSATDIFFDFLTFDPSLDINQLLGVEDDFSIPNGTTTALVDLFSIGLGPGNGIFPVTFVIQDVNGNVSDVGSVTVSTSSVPAPEPAEGILLAIGMSVLLGSAFLATKRSPAQTIS